MNACSAELAAIASTVPITNNAASPVRPAAKWTSLVVHSIRKIRRLPMAQVRQAIAKVDEDSLIMTISLRFSKRPD